MLKILPAHDDPWATAESFEGLEVTYIYPERFQPRVYRSTTIMGSKVLYGAADWPSLDEWLDRCNALNENPDAISKGRLVTVTVTLTGYTFESRAYGGGYRSGLKARPVSIRLLDNVTDLVRAATRA